MAIGSATLFDEYQLDSNKAVHLLGTNTLKLVIVTDTSPPAVDDATPRYSDYSANEVSNAGGYPTGGITLTTVTFTMVAGVATLKADDVNLAMDPSGFTDGYYGILINDSATNKEAVGFWDLEGPISEQAGPISLEFTDGVVAEFPANVAA